MIHFPNATLHRYIPTLNATGVYGEKVQSYKYSNDIICDFQNENNNEIIEKYGIEKENLYRIYIDINTTLGRYDQLEDEKGIRYHIIGEVETYNHFHNYKKVHLERIRRKGGD